MSNIIISNDQVTMSSREIAELVDSRHDKVKQSIERLAARGVIQLPPLGDVKNHLGQAVSEYRICKRDSYVIVAQLSPEFTARLVDRWQELEATKAQPVAIDFNDPAKLRGYLLQATEEIEQRDKKILYLTPKAVALDRIATADGSLCITNAAKDLQVRPKDLFSYLSRNRWIYKRTGSGSWTAYQERIQQGLLEHKTTTVNRSDGSEKITEQVRVTPKGLTKLAMLLAEGNVA
ncbi:MAG: phage antirepressor KilAC domain-containing protein [Pontibacterium sp.]